MEDTMLFKDNLPPGCEGKEKFSFCPPAITSSASSDQIRAAATERKGKKPVACLIHFFSNAILALER